MKSINKNIFFIFLLGLTSTLLTSCGGDDGTTPSATAPSDLVYEPNTLTTDVGVAGESEAPTIKGTAPITYSITTTPDAGTEITIDKNTGVISTTAATAGNYKVTVMASNEAGDVEFKDAFTIDVTSKVKITYKGNIQGFITQSCAPCHVYGGSETNYADSYTTAKNAIDFIIDRVNRDQGSAGFMPYGGTKLDAATLAMINQWKTDGLLEE